MDEISTVTTSTSKIKSWQSIITLIVFVCTNIVVLFPIQIPIPRRLSEAIQNSPTLHDLGVISLKPEGTQLHEIKDKNSRVLKFPLNFVTAPLIADLFLLAVRAIGRQEVHDGILGANNILPYNIMIFFLTLAYIAISIDCSGLIRWLAVTVLQKGGKRGRVLFLLLYIFFFVLGSFIGNDPIVLSGTAFLAYMTRIAPNIKHPRAWIHTQFAVANIASAILVSSNPTNLVLAGAFGIKFITYTANMVVPVFVTIIVLFPFLLYMIFHEENLIPLTIQVRKLTRKEKAEKPLDPKIPDSREIAGSQGDDVLEVLHPFIDWYSAVVGAFVMSATLVTLLVLNASDQKHGGRERPVFYVTLPGAFVMFCWDLGWGWRNRKATRLTAQRGFEAKEARRAQQMQQEAQEMVQAQQIMSTALREEDQEQGFAAMHVAGECLSPNDRRESRIVRFVRRSRATFPTVTEVLKLLPYALLPFAFSMFILVQGLVSKGWVAVFAFGWDYWVNTTGTLGAICGMAFLSVILCNFAGTNIGTTILLCRVIQTWQQIHLNNKLPISDRTLWGTIYAMALGVNYGAFSSAFSASLAGLLWRDILNKKGIPVLRLEFARINLPIISIAMAFGCSTLIAQVYVMRNSKPYDA